MANFSVVHTETTDETKPAGNRARSLGDDDIREFKRTIRERLAVDHQFLADETGITNIGTHKKISFTETQAADPTAYDDTGYLYIKTVAGIKELFWKDSSGNVKQLTTAGKLNAVELTGDQTVAGIKTFSTPIAVASGGTGANAAAAARTNLLAAVSGANSDITSLLGLTTPLSQGQGGTGNTKLYSTGSFAGSGVQGTAVAHGLGRTPAFIFWASITGGTGDNALWVSGMGSNVRSSVSGVHGITTAPDATNFYLPTSGDGNGGGTTYYFVVI